MPTALLAAYVRSFSSWLAVLPGGGAIPAPLRGQAAAAPRRSRLLAARAPAHLSAAGAHQPSPITPAAPPNLEQSTTANGTKTPDPAQEVPNCSRNRLRPCQKSAFPHPQNTFLHTFSTQNRPFRTPKWPLAEP